jgi:hypothetical protein
MQYVFSNAMNMYAVVSSLNVDRMAENIWAENQRLSETETAYLEG